MTWQFIRVSTFAVYSAVMFGASHVPQRTLVKLFLEDGSTTVVSVKLPLSGKLHEAFNNADMFLDVISAKGEPAFIAKSRVVRAEPVNPPHAKLNQQRRQSDQSAFDPHAVLGVANSASKDDIRAAYVALVKLYHPDRYATLDIPQEMKDYAAAMQARINMAYEQIGN